MKTIAISGKGGTGKSTLSALIIRWLKEQEMGPILAVDADSNVNLNDLLGVQIEETVGAIREELKKSAHKLPGGMTKQEFLEYKIHASLRESRDFDLIVMGRPEGPGCYCYANNLLRDILKTLSDNYKIIVIDNEAGMEHLSRRMTQKIDILLLVSDPSARGVRAAGKISKLLSELDTRVGKKILVLNRVKGSIPDILDKIIEEQGLHLFSSVPEDDTLLRMDQSGKPIWKIEEDTPAYLAIHQMMNKLIEGKNNGV
ncbi:MAG: AAA family ATPase [Candidatus Aminicenantaceae bacterium]